MPFVTHYSALQCPYLPRLRGHNRLGRRATARCSADDNARRPDPPPTPPPPTRASFAIDDPSQTVVWGGNLPRPRRIVLGTLSASTVALVANLAGCTSALLSIDGGATARTLRADVLYPVAGFKRCLDLGNGFEFCYPDRWLADQTVAARQAQRRERQFSLDPLPTARGRQLAEPVVAFGPPGTTGEENISVIVAPIQPGFQLTSLGDPFTFGSTFVSTTVAPNGSGLTAALLHAQQRTVQGIVYYQIEYTVEGPRFQRHNVSVIAASAKDTLYTLNVQCPIALWQRDGAALQQAAASFQLLV